MANPRIPKEYLGAFKCGHRKSARDYIDEDLSWKLLEKIKTTGCEDSKELLLYIARFNNEYYRNTIKKEDPENLHNEVLRLECHRSHYRRSCDVFSNCNLIYLTPELEKAIGG